MKGVGVEERKSLAKNVIQRVIKEREHGGDQVYLRMVGWIKALPGDGLCEQGFNQPQPISAHAKKYFKKIMTNDYAVCWEVQLLLYAWKWI